MSFEFRIAGSFDGKDLSQAVLAPDYHWKGFSRPESDLRRLDPADQKDQNLSATPFFHYGNQNGFLSGGRSAHKHVDTSFEGLSMRLSSASGFLLKPDNPLT